jgi:hypothetical protein
MNPAANFEADTRFPSGKWTGFFTDKRIPGKHWMELHLVFSRGTMTGSGRDFVGAFVIDGAYQLSDGRCLWVKQYIGKHAVGYRGFNEGKGIWGTWEMTDSGRRFTGGFHIWPEGMADPSQPVIEEEADIPADVESEELLPTGA